MAENILKGTIKIDAPGIDQTAQSVNNALDKITEGTRKLSASSYLARDAINDMSHELRDLPYALNNPSLLAGPFGRLQALFFDLKQQTGSMQGAFSALSSSLMGGGGLLLASNLLVSAFAILGPKIFGMGQELSEAQKKVEEYNKTVHEAFESVASEAAKVEVLYASLNRENVPRREKIAIIKELQRIQPEYFGQLDAEKASVNQLRVAYESYIGSLNAAAEAKVLEKQLEDIINKRLELERKLGSTNIFSQQFTYDANGVKMQNIRLHQGDEIIDQQKELVGLKKQEAEISTQLSHLTPPHITEADLKAPKIKIDKEDFQKRIHEAIYDPDFGDLPGRFIKELIQSFYERSGGAYLDYKPNPEFVKYLQKTIGSIVGDTSFNLFKGGQNVLRIPVTAELNFTKSKESGLDIDELKAITKEIQNTLTPAFQNLFSAIEQGKPALQAFFQSIEQSLVQVVAKLAAAAVEAEIFSSILNPSQQNKIFNLAGDSSGFFSIFSKILGFSSGGEVPGSGNTDSVPALLTPGELVIPKQYAQFIKGLVKGSPQTLNSVNSTLRTSAYSSNASIGSAGIHVTIAGEFRQRGYDMVATIAKVNQKQGRAFVG